MDKLTRQTLWRCPDVSPRARAGELSLCRRLQHAPKGPWRENCSSRYARN
jgi:hypothetical protein